MMLVKMKKAKYPKQKRERICLTVAARDHFNWGMLVRGCHPSIPWAQQRVLGVRAPLVQQSFNSLKLKGPARSLVDPCDHEECYAQNTFHSESYVGIL